MKTLTVAAWLCIALGAAPIASGAGDAGAGPARRAQPGPADRRLDARVTLEARHQPLDGFLAAIGKGASVTLRTESAAGDLRVIALLRDQPVREVLGRLAEMLNLTWRERPGADGAEYTLFESREDRAAIEREKAREWAQFRRNFRLLIAAATRDTPVTDDPFDRLAHDLARNATIRRAATLLGALPDDMLERALGPGGLVVPYGQMPPGLRELFRGQNESLLAERRALREQATEGRNPRFKVLPPRPPTPTEHLALEVRVVRRTGDGLHAHLQVGARGPGGREGSAVGLALDPTASFSPQEQEAVRRNWGSRSVPGKDPLTFRPAPARERWEDAVLRFASENRVSFLAEAYDVTDEPADGAARKLPDDAPPQQVLDRLCMAYDETWNAEAPLLLFRRRDWYFVRDRQIPASVERRWSEYAVEPGWFPIAELALMAQMGAENEGKRARLWRYAGEDAARSAMRDADVLSLYRSLTPAQRAAAHAGGLSVDRFEVSQRPRLQAVVTRLRPEARGLSESFRSLHARESDGTRPAVLRLLFRDTREISIPLPCRARPLRDPMVDLE